MRRCYWAGGLRFPARFKSAAHAGLRSACRALRQDRIRPPPGAMPLQNFSASALHSSRTLSAFSARAFIPSRHAGESSASCAFMHFAIAPCPGLTSPQNLLTSATQGPSLRCWAPASAARPAANSTNTNEANVLLIDMVPPKFFSTIRPLPRQIAWNGYEWGIITPTREEAHDSLFAHPRRPHGPVPRAQGLDGESEPQALGRYAGRNRGERRRGARPRADGLGRSAAQDVLERSADSLRGGRGHAAHRRRARCGRFRARRASHGGRLPQLAIVGRGGRSGARRPRPRPHARDGGG